jgi:hypothetical protein
MSLRWLQQNRNESLDVPPNDSASAAFRESTELFSADLSVPLKHVGLANTCC